jgi:hypothetical protein
LSSRFHALKKLDVLVIALALFSVILSFLLIPRQSAHAPVLVIYEGACRRVHSLDDSDFEARSRWGSVKIRIRDGKVRLLDSTCPDKWCIRMGTLHLPGDSIVCLPSRILLVIEGQEKSPEGKFDALIR